jgi:hypothetical protein
MDIFNEAETHRLMQVKIRPSVIFEQLELIPISRLHPVHLSRAEAQWLAENLSEYGASIIIPVLVALRSGLLDPRMTALTEAQFEIVFARIKHFLDNSPSAIKAFNSCYSDVMDSLIYSLPLEDKIEEIKQGAHSYVKMALSKDFLKLARQYSGKEIARVRRALAIHQTSVGHRDFAQDHFWMNLANQNNHDMLNPESMATALTICRWMEKGQKTYLLDDDLFEKIEIQRPPDNNTDIDKHDRIEELYNKHVELVRKVSGGYDEVTLSNAQAVYIDPDKFDKLKEDSPEMVRLRESKKAVQQAVMDYISLDSFKIELPEALKDDSFDPILVITPDHTMTFIASLEVKKRIPYNPSQLWKMGGTFQRNIFYQEMLRQKYGDCLIQKGWIALTMDDSRVPRIDRFAHFQMNRERCSATMHVGLSQALTALNLVTCLQNPKTVAVWKDRPKNRKKNKKKRFTTVADKPRFHSIQVDPTFLEEIKPLVINPSNSSGGEKCQHERSATTANIWVTRKNLKHGETILGTRTNHAGNQVFRVTRPRAGATVNPHLARKERKPFSITRVKSTTIDRV